MIGVGRDGAAWGRVGLGGAERDATRDGQGGGMAPRLFSVEDGCRIDACLENTRPLGL